MADVQSGKTYLGFYCAKCSKPIPLIEDPTQGHVHLGGQGKLHVTCPHCGHQAAYPAAEAQHLQAHTAH